MELKKGRRGFLARFRKILIDCATDVVYHARFSMLMLTLDHWNDFCLRSAKSMAKLNESAFFRSLYSFAVL